LSTARARPAVGTVWALGLWAWLSACSGSDGSGPPKNPYDGGGGSGADSGPRLECNQTPCAGNLIGSWQNQKLCSVNDIFGEVDRETYSADGSYTSTHLDGVGPRSGSWIASGTRVTITLADSTSYSTDYCVTNDQVLWTRYSPDVAIVLIRAP